MPREIGQQYPDDLAFRLYEGTQVKTRGGGATSAAKTRFAQRITRFCFLTLIRCPLVSTAGKASAFSRCQRVIAARLRCLGVVITRRRLEELPAVYACDAAATALSADKP